jgi:Domain of unknown function (DUF4190)
MTSQGGGHGRNSGDHTPPFGQPAAPPQPWPQYPYPPVDPQAPLNYPEYPPNYPPPPPGYGIPPQVPPYYPGPYDPYSQYRGGPASTNGLAVASLVTAIAGVLIGIPLAVVYVGVLIPIMAVVFGGVALNQIKLTNQQGRGMAITGIAIGASTLALLVIVIVFIAATVHSLTLLH